MLNTRMVQTVLSQHLSLAALAGFVFTGITVWWFAGDPMLPAQQGNDEPAASDMAASGIWECDPPLEELVSKQERARHLARLGVPAWHKAGFRGQGMKVAILDSGFRDYQAHLDKALPAHVRSCSFRRDGNLEAKDSQHGILCAEVVHALAPDAELLFANWEQESPETFLEAVRWVKEQGVRIISCSIIMPSWSDGEGNGPIHQKLKHLLGDGTAANDLLLFASAGNTAQRHWSGPFHDNGKGFHVWEAESIDNPLSPWSNEKVSIELCWQPGGSYEITIWDSTLDTTVTRVAARPGSGFTCTVASLHPQSGHEYQVRVRHLDGSATPFHIVALGAGLRYSQARGSIPFPGDGPEVIAVGAVHANYQRASYSSCGPNSQQPKPDLVACVPFCSLWRTRSFSGTSAAAPQAAGLAAVLWSRSPQATARTIRETLRQAAQDLGPSGHDYETGYGLVGLPSLQTSGGTKSSTAVGSIPHPASKGAKARSPQTSTATAGSNGR